MRKLSTGEPCAGEPHARFGGRGDLLPYPYLVPLAVNTNSDWLDRRYVSWEDLKQDEDVEEEFTEEF